MRLSWVEWREKLAHGAPTFQSEPSESIKMMSEQFGAFCALSGTVLDVGCGPRRAPYLKGVSDPIGFDALPNRAERFQMVRGVGECLPFKDDAFNHAVAATSLDHCLDPACVVKEMARVSRTVHIWVNSWHQDGTIGSQPKHEGNMMRTMLRLIRERDYLTIIERFCARLLKVIERALVWIPHRLNARKDLYHLHHFREKDILHYIKAADLAIRKRAEMWDGSITITAEKTDFPLDDA